MFGAEERKIKVVMLIIWGGLTSVMMVFYFSVKPAQDCRDFSTTSCAASMTQSWHKPTAQSQTTKGIFKSDECLPKVNIMFMKTHKTASSTLLNILFRFGEKHKLRFAFPNGRNDFYYPSPFVCSKVNDYKPGECFNIICNHMRFDAQEVAKLLPEDSVYITILRDPAEMFESSFHYYKRAIPLTWSIRGDDKLSTFLQNPWEYYTPGAYNSFYLRNLLLFDFGFDNNMEPDDPQVASVIRGLSERFHLVLMAEHFEESLILLKDALCWTMEDLAFFKLNTRKGSSVFRLTPKLRAKALEWNGADWRLFQHFNSTFWARIEAYGAKRMEQEVKKLRMMNAKLKAICIEGRDAVEAKMIQDSSLLPWQPVGESSILGYNIRKDVDPKYRTLCHKMLTPEIQYLSDLGVNLWITRLWGWIKMLFTE